MSAFTQETGLELASELAKQNTLLSVIASTTSSAALTKDWQSVSTSIKEGLGSNLFPIGTQIVIPWTDTRTTVSTTWNLVFDVVHHGKVTLKDGEIVNGMYLQSHYTLPFGTQFDNYEAFYYATNGLSAGTYNVTMGYTWGSNVVSGKSYQFTLTKDLPAGGQLSGFLRSPDTSPSTWTVSSWASPNATTATETVSVTEGSDGTNLGTFTAAGGNGLNSLQRTSFGNNRWSYSAVEQFLNSNKAAESWWSSKHNYDRSPDYLSTTAGFMSGFSDDFLKVVGEIKNQTQTSTLSDSGVTDTTYDKFFLPSAEQHYFNTYLGTTSGVEGEYWEYWKRVSKSATPLAGLGTYSQMISYAIDNKTSARTVWLRSANRGYSGGVGYVNSSGYVSNAGAYYGNSVSPACVII